MQRQLGGSADVAGRAKEPSSTRCVHLKLEVKRGNNMNPAALHVRKRQTGLIQNKKDLMFVSGKYLHWRL